MQHTSGHGIPMIDYIVYHVVHMMDTAGIKPVEYLHSKYESKTALYTLNTL